VSESRVEPTRGRGSAVSVTNTKKTSSKWKKQWHRLHSATGCCICDLSDRW